MRKKKKKKRPSLKTTSGAMLVTIEFNLIRETARWGHFQEDLYQLPDKNEQLFFFANCTFSQRTEARVNS